MKESIGLEIAYSSYAIVGAASMLAGYARHTFSLALIIMESTESIQLFIPVTFAILVSYSVGGLFTRSIYINAVRSKNIPLLIEEIPEGQEHIIASEIMANDVKTLSINPQIYEI